jgi:hypothetical protein
MSPDRSFRFVNETLNRRLLSLLRASALDHSVAADGKVHYHSADEDRFEDVLAQVRADVFPDWQVLSFPQDWADRYRAALAERAVSYEEELNNGAVEFLLSGHHRPHAWKIA